jgi:hypothetical protein
VCAIQDMMCVPFKRDGDADKSRGDDRERDRRETSKRHGHTDSDKHRDRETDVHKEVTLHHYTISIIFLVKVLLSCSSFFGSLNMSRYDFPILHLICGELCRRTKIKIKILGDQTMIARGGRQWASGQWASVSRGKSVKRSDATRMSKWRHLVVAVAVEEAPTTMTSPTTMLLLSLHFLLLLHSLRPNKKSWICARVSSRAKRAMEAPQPERATKARWLLTPPTLCHCLCLLYALCLLTPPTNLGTTL